MGLLSPDRPAGACRQPRKRLPAALKRLLRKFPERDCWSHPNSTRDPLK
jgi:hypothetical protein